MIADVHKPIMVKEILSFLNNDKELSILDCTFGGGGHTISFLDLGHRVTAIDHEKPGLLSRTSATQVGMLNAFRNLIT